MLRENLPDLADLDLVESVAHKAANVQRLLRNIARDYAPAVFANSLGAEDMVLTDMIFREGLDIGVFSLDTGRLPEETHALIAASEARYGRRIDIIYPRHEVVAQTVAVHGINGFYDSVEARKACCHARKVEPLQRALAGKQAWITGLRAAQAATRTELKVMAWDKANELVKFSPLADWSEREVWVYLRANDVPYNKLHDRSYPSIGCAPCTRAIQPGEDIRAGRWWWETPEQKECGLHVVNGKLVRAEKVGPSTGSGQATGDTAQGAAA
jgi:phosphoadenosine phosphosulfate reductase